MIHEASLGTPSTTTKNNAGPGTRMAGLGGSCATCNVAEPSSFPVKLVRSSTCRWPMFIACVLNPVRMMTALVALIFSALLFKSAKVSSMSNEFPPSDDEHFHCGCLGTPTSDLVRHPCRCGPWLVPAVCQRDFAAWSSDYSLVGVEDLYLILRDVDRVRVRIVIHDWMGLIRQSSPVCTTHNRHWGYYPKPRPIRPQAGSRWNGTFLGWMTKRPGTNEILQA